MRSFRVHLILKNKIRHFSAEKKKKIKISQKIHQYIHCTCKYFWNFKIKRKLGAILMYNVICSPFWHLVENKILKDNHRQFSPGLAYIFPTFDFPMADPDFPGSVQRLRQLCGIQPQCLIIWFCWADCRTHLRPPNDVYGTMPATTQNSKLGEKKKRKGKRTERNKKPLRMFVCVLLFKKSLVNV